MTFWVQHLEFKSFSEKESLLTVSHCAVFEANSDRRSHAETNPQERVPCSRL